MSRPTSNRNALTFIFFTVFIDMTGFGIIIPVMPELIMELTGQGLGRSALYAGWLLFVFAVLQFFFAPLIGNLSDRFGRRPVLLLALSAYGLDYLVLGLAPSIGWLFVGRCISGVTGASHSTANAYIADVSAPEDRAKNFGLVGAAFGLGFILGPVIGGLLGGYGSRVPFFFAAGLALVNVVYGLVILPESLAREERRPFSWRRANPLGALVQMRRYPVVLALFLVVAFYMLAHDANPSTWTYFTMLKFGWSEREVGYSLGFVGLMFALVQGSLIRAAIPRIGERRAAVLGITMMGLGFAGFAFSTQSWQLVAFIVPFSLSGLAMPALRGIMANQVPDNAQGELQGAITSVLSLTAIVAPVLMTQLFGYFTSAAAPLYFPGAPFLTAACLMVACLIQFARVMTRIVGPTTEP